MFAILFSAICAWFAFLLPTFSTYKVLSQRPINEAELEKLGMYWSVIGAMVAVEYLAEWLVSWLPFYWELKTAFLLFLSLPQTQGSTYIYNAYLKTFLTKNEQHIDAGIIAIQASIFTFVQTRFTAVCDLLWSIITKQEVKGQVPPSATTQPGTTGQGFSVDSAMSAWRTYGPAFMNAIQQGRQGSAVAEKSAPSTATSSAIPTPSAPIVDPIAA